MGTPTRIGIWPVNTETRDTEQLLLAEGYLLGPNWVVARCVPTDALAQIAQDGDPRRLRVAVAAAYDDAPEVIEVAGIERKTFPETDVLLVGVWLTRRTNVAPYELIPGVGPESDGNYSEQDCKEVLKYLQNPPRNPEIDTRGYFERGSVPRAGFGGRKV